MTTSTKIAFQPLWDAHPAVQGDPSPCLNKAGEPAFANQCAIRMGVALKAVGITVTGCKVCWHGHSGKQHVLLAEQLATFLLGQKRKLGTVEKKKGKNWDSKDGVDVTHYHGRKGIIFFKDFWTRDGESESNPTGDHIDVWDGASQGQGSDGYFERSKQLWFWELT